MFHEPKNELISAIFPKLISFDVSAEINMSNIRINHNQKTNNLTRFHCVYLFNKMLTTFRKILKYKLNLFRQDQIH